MTTVEVMNELAEALRDLAGKMDPANHAYVSTGVRADGSPSATCQPRAELDDYERQAREAFQRAREVLS